MKKQQFFLIAIALVLLCVIYFFGNTVPPKKSSSAVITAAKDSSSFNIDKVLAASKTQLTPSLAAHIEQLESSVATADNITKAGVFRQIADIYKDSAHMLLPFAWYTGEAAKLESSEKNLTFAARYYLESARTQHDNFLKNWMAGE